MKAIPLISIVMPLYNKRPYVKRAIESVQRQTLTNWELIIVNDGSTDGSSVEIPRNDSRIRLFCQKNKGPGAARNRGIRMALGEFVTFIDADDYYYSHKLEKEMDHLWKEQRAEWMMSAFEYDMKNELKFHYIKDINGKELEGEILVFDKALNQLTVAGWPSDGLCIKKSLLNRLGGFREDMRYGEITELMIRCALMQPRVLIYQIPLYRVIDVPKSASKMSPHRVEAMRQMGESLYKLSKDYPEYSQHLSFSSRRSLYSYVATLILNGKSSEARKYLSYNFPHKIEKKWWKMWVGSWLPNWLLHHIVRISSDLKQTQ